MMVQLPIGVRRHLHYDGAPEVSQPEPALALSDPNNLLSSFRAVRYGWAQQAERDRAAAPS